MRGLMMLGAAVSLTLVGLAARAEDKDEAKGTKVAYEVYGGYFEKNNSDLKGDASYLAVTNQEAFDKVFGLGVVMGKKPKVLPKDAFDTKLVLAVIKRGGDIWTYKVEKVTADEDMLIVQYTATSKDGGGAKFASPLIVSVEKNKRKFTKVAFIENGKKVGTTEIER